MNYYLKNKYGKKVAKIPLNAGFTCPNRDGSKSIGGCTFCSEKGSGDSILDFEKDLKIQYQSGLERMQKKWPDCLGIAYFQSYSNTYADIHTLKEIYDPFFLDSTCVAVAIATRADCMNDEILDYFITMSKYKDIWIEFGLQSVHEKTMDACNRAHSTQLVFDWVYRLNQTPIHTCIHIMNSLPNETKDDMLETAKQVAKAHPDAIKIHMLHLLQNTEMARQYNKEPFHILSLEDYVDIVVDQLELLPSDCIIERVTGDGLATDLILPTWTIKKTIVINEIDKLMVKRNTWQGKKNNLK